MDTLIREATADTPYIKFDADNNHFEIIGRSIPEDVIEFYRPILDWINQYLQSPNKNTVLQFQLEYFNTASSKMILDLIMKFEPLLEKRDHEVKVLWYYKKGDKKLREAGEELGELVEIPFEVLEFQGE